VKGGNQSWAIRWYAHAFIHEKLVLYPRRAVTYNIGFDGSGTHGAKRVAMRGSSGGSADRSVSHRGAGERDGTPRLWKAALSEMAGPTRGGLASELKVSPEARVPSATVGI